MEIPHDSMRMLAHTNLAGIFQTKVPRAYGKKVIPNTRKRVTNLHISGLCAHLNPWNRAPTKAPKLTNRKKKNHKDLGFFLFFKRTASAKNRFSNERRKSVMAVIGSNMSRFVVVILS